MSYTFVINCTAMGIPTPEVIWRLNWGHVPDKCRQGGNSIEHFWLQVRLEKRIEIPFFIPRHVQTTHF